MVFDAIDQFQSTEITSKQEGLDHMLTFSTDFSHFKAKLIGNLKVGNFTKKLTHGFSRFSDQFQLSK